jgi:TetR/AcrR family transcriptional regulator
MARHKEAEREAVQSETRELLLQAAAEEFARHGYAGANINRSSRSAGFAKGTIYNYFPSKRGLMLALIDETAQAHLDNILAQVQEEDDAARRLVRFFEAGFAFVTDHLAPSRVMVNNIYGPDAEFKQHMWQAYWPMFRLVSTDIITAGITQGVFRPVDPDATAILLMTVYLGTGSQVDENGRLWLDPGQVADFALNALRQADQTLEREG